ncbi:MAG: hypothetical protein WCK76_01010 [Elusimicrobiota bacterium]
MKNKILLLMSALLLGACSHAVRETVLSQPPQVTPPVEPPVPVLHRTYTEGEVLKYKLTLDYSETGEDDSSASASAVATVKKRGDSVFYEAWQWTGRKKNGADIKLPAESLDFRQLLSLDPGFKLSIQDLSKIYPLIEPVTDTLTFYADLQLAMRKGLALTVGEHLFIEHGLPNSWAGGPTAVGRDCVDFDLTLTDINAADNTATLRALHLPPAAGCGAAPVPWLQKPVSDTANNWYQVRKEGKSIYIASAAKETFDDEIKIGLADGHIVSATQFNLLTGEKRTCLDEKLAMCGAPGRFSIVRKLLLAPEAE